ncbi:MAG TPA: hypothetical protein VH593_26645, partial [Ktedonobacteraceae bacterium]
DPDYITMDTGTTWVQVSFNMGIPDRSINHIKLMLNTITVAEMDVNSVGGAQIIAGSVDSGRLANNAVIYSKVDATLKPSQGAADGAEALRYLMNPNTGTPSAGAAAKGIHAIQHRKGGVDPLDMYFQAIPSYTSAIPATATDGTEIYLSVDPSNSIIWHLRYKQANDHWEFLGGSPKWISGATNYTIPFAGAYLIHVRADMNGDVSDRSGNSITHLYVRKNGSNQISSVGSVNGDVWAQTMDTKGIVTCAKNDVMSIAGGVDFPSTWSFGGVFQEFTPTYLTYS